MSFLLWCQRKLLQYTWTWFLLPLFCFLKQRELTNFRCIFLFLRCYQQDQLPFMQTAPNFVDRKNIWPSLENCSAHYFVFCCCGTDVLSSFHGYIKSRYSGAIWSFIQITDRISQNHRLFPLTDCWGIWFLLKILKMKQENIHNQQKGLWTRFFLKRNCSHSQHS